MASYKFAAILAVLVGVSVIQNVQAQGAGSAAAPSAGDLPGFTSGQYNDISNSLRTIFTTFYQALMNTVAQQQMAQAATGAGDAAASATGAARK